MVIITNITAIEKLPFKIDLDALVMNFSGKISDSRDTAGSSNITLYIGGLAVNVFPSGKIQFMGAKDIKTINDVASAVASLLQDFIENSNIPEPLPAKNQARGAMLKRRSISQR